MTTTIVAWGFTGPALLTIGRAADELDREHDIRLIRVPLDEDLPPEADVVWVQGAMNPMLGERILAAVGGRPLFSSPPVAQSLQIATAHGTGMGRPPRNPSPEARIALALRLVTPGRLVHAGRLSALVAEHTDVDPGPMPDDIPRGIFDTGRGPEHPVGTCGIIGTGLNVAAGDADYLRTIARVLNSLDVATCTWLGSPEDMPGDMKNRVDVWLNLTGFTACGNHGAPATDKGTALAEETDAQLLTPVPLQRGTLSDWRADPGPVGLWPAAVSMNIAVPELEGATVPWVFMGRDVDTNHLTPDDTAITRLAERVRRTIDLRRARPADRKVSVTIFGYDGDGTVGTAAQLDVFASLHALLRRLKEEGYTVEVPDTVEELTDILVGDGAGGARSQASELARWRATDYARVLGEHAARIDGPWGRLPGTVDTDGRDLIIRGARFGNVIVGVQPQFGDVSDPAELLMANDSTPSHSFAAYYLWLEHVFGHDVMLHFGTHGALEFMPGRQTGLAAADWPVLLTGSVPHHYLYVMANPGEGTIAKRRSAASLITYLTPPLADAGLYGALDELAELLDAHLSSGRGAGPVPREIIDAALRADFTVEQAQDPAELRRELERVRRSPIALGLHTVGRPMEQRQTARSLELAATYLADTGEAERTAILADLEEKLQSNTELDALVRVLAGGYTPPVVGGDPARRPDALPTGRNLHAIDPVSVPSASAIARGRKTAEQLIAAHVDAHGSFPESVAIVLWGIDNIKTGGEGIAQAFALLGVEPVAGPRGRVDTFRILSPEDLGRPRVDVVCTLSGVCRDVLPQPVQLLDEAVRAVAALDEPDELNPLAAHTRAHAEETDTTAVEAATRIFSAAAGSYGTGVNKLVQAGDWDGGEDLAEMYLTRMGHAWGTGADGADAGAVLRKVLGTVDATFQNVDSAETSIAGIDHYFEFLGGVTGAITQLRGDAPASFVSQSWAADINVGTLRDAMQLESRTRLLNPKWVEGQLAHGYAGVAQVRTRLENTFGMQATTGTVDGWVFDRAAENLLLDEDVRGRMQRANPAAVNSMTNRLLEAADRGLWDADRDTLDRLEDIADQLDGVLEGIEEV
ncbi:cobaltochelatase subunit CobN [Corynebacterium sp. P6129]|uniref:cobaltochelatase subunit CobN n=1 Tax=Corynebacterium antarcticum TaxID=2800405 RepID=UPI002260DE73|nr:cobaltochelatase subunit CobN [Corynebacterium antarcticum]MCX7491716.1 cobaltochelatase subunit CobN [Corynebacterium antarcticum]